MHKWGKKWITKQEKTKGPKAPINKKTHSIIFQIILIYHIDICGRAGGGLRRRKNIGIKANTKSLGIQMDGITLR